MNNMKDNIKLVGFDLDGTLTDGGFYYLGEGKWGQRYSVRDGVGIKELQKRGITVAIISHSQFESAVERAKMLKIEHAYFGVEDKLAVWSELLEKLELQNDQCAYMGDERADLPVIQAAGIGATVFEAEPDVRELSDWVATKPAGGGAGREFIEYLITS